MQHPSAYPALMNNPMALSGMRAFAPIYSPFIIPGLEMGLGAAPWLRTGDLSILFISLNTLTLSLTLSLPLSLYLSLYLSLLPFLLTLDQVGGFHSICPCQRYAEERTCATFIFSSNLFFLTSQFTLPIYSCTHNLFLPYFSFLGVRPCSSDAWGAWL